MGDVTTHKEVNEHVIPQLEAISANENYTYIEFGNFLTDISQFRDPTAYFGAKKITWLKLLALSPLACGQLGGFLGSSNLREWIDVMFGNSSPPEKRHGAIGTFFKHLGRAFAHVKFAADSPCHYKQLQPLTAAEIERIYAWAFTQYYPHEHLDAPPLRKGVDPTRLRSFKPLNRHLVGYLEQYIQFISEELTRLEIDWVQNRNLPASAPVRCDLLVRLGHLLHAVEDFYFHSNAVELRQWNQILEANPDRQPKESAEDYRFLVANLLSGTGLDPTSVHLRRRLARRLRYPIFHEDGKLMTDVSRLAVDFAYTGGFGKTDVAHTISSGLLSVEASLKQEYSNLADLVKELPMPLLRALLSAEERRKLTSSCANLEQSMTTHKQHIESRDYVAAFAILRASGKITASAEQALLDAFNLDRDVALTYDKMPGPGNFLLLWLTDIQGESDKSHAKAENLDSDAESMYASNADNGASEETIGTHSLMAKDSPEKEPLRKEAMALAKFASAALSVTLLRRIRDEPDASRGLNWELLLRHYLRIPSGRPDSWEEEVLTAVNAGGAIPTLDSVQDKPNFGMISSGEISARRHGQIRTALERRYEDLEQYTEHSLTILE